MAELMGSALLSALFNVLIERLATEEVKNFLRPKTVINELLGKLEVSLLPAHEFLDVAEEQRIYNPRVEDWHNKLKDVVYKASELADKIETEALRRNMERHQPACNITKMFTKLCSNPTKLCSIPLKSFDNCVKDELEEILSSLEILSQKNAHDLESTGKGNYSGVKTRVSERSTRPTPFVRESDFFGREGIKETIMQSLRSAEVGGNEVSVIPVIGAGGIGKTTLVQIIYDHPEVKQLFEEARAWITVSTEFDLPTITKTIIEKIAHPSPITGNEDQKGLLDKLRDALTGKKFLLVLDDVWSEDHDLKWETLKSCFMYGMSGSKVIVTTRSRNVASIMAPNQDPHVLPELPEEDCLKLFALTVFGDDQDPDAYPDLQEICEKIVHKCKGNPLSVRSVGGILRRQRCREKWEKLLESSIWELLKGDKHIIPSLWLSYLYLPSEIKPCFAYCSIFPKDYPFQKEELVLLWMAEGFLQHEAGKRGVTMEVVGGLFFEELISRSLFQRSNYGGTFIMHDLVHDLAMNVSGEFCLCLDGGKNLGDLSCKTRYLSYKMENLDVKKFEGSKAKRLHSFVKLHPSGGLRSFGGGLRFFGGGLLRGSTEIGGDILKVLEELAMEGGCLRVLSLSSVYAMKSLPDSIGDLKHLRYLNLSETRVEKLPDLVGTLYNLQTLLLSNCRKLTQLPSNLGRLINLRHLDTRNSSLKEMPPRMCKLTKLQTLTDFIVGKRGSSIGDLGELDDLNGELRISGLQNVDHVLKGNLDKKNLSKLVLQWEGQTDASRDSRKGERVLDALHPHANLKELFIYDYGGTRFPDWVGDSLFSKIERMHLNGCRDCSFLLSLGRLPSLKELRIQGFHRLETIDDGFNGNDSPFKSLEVLHFEDMPEWKRWSVIEFPHLKKLKLKGCPKLVRGLPNSSTITVLDIYECESLDFPENHHYPSLERLKMVQSCGSIRRLSLEHLPKLNELELKGLECLVELTGESPNELERLSIEKCPKLESMGNGRYGSLEVLQIVKCEALKSIPLDYFPKLNKLDLWELKCLVGLTGESLKDLQILSIKECPKLEFMWNGGYGSLKILEIEKCEGLKSIPLCYFPKLNWLTLRRCQNFESFRFAEEPPLVLESLTFLDLNNLPKLMSLPQQMHRLLPSLKHLIVDNCREIDSWPEGGLLSNLEALEIWGCKKLLAQVMHWDLQFTCLKSLKIVECGEELSDSSPPEGLLRTSLTSLGIHKFPRLETIIIEPQRPDQ